MNFGKLGNRLNIYGGIYIAGSVLAIFISIAIYSQEFTLATNEEIIFILNFIIKLISEIAFVFVIKELFLSAKNISTYEVILRRCAGLFSIGLLITINIAFYIFNNGIVLTNITTTTYLIALIPTFINLISYISFAHFGLVFSKKFSHNPSATNISKGLIFLVVGECTSLFIDLLEIPIGCNLFMKFIGFIASILSMIGIFLSGNGFSVFDPNWKLPEDSSLNLIRPNFDKLGKTLNIYSGIVIICGVLSILLSGYIYLETLNLDMIGKFKLISNLKLVFIWNFISSVILIVSFGFVIKEILLFARNILTYKSVLHRSAVIFSIGLVISFFFNIIAFLSGLSLMNDLIKFTELQDILIVIDQISLFDKLFLLIPMMINFIGYINFALVGFIISQNFLQNPSTLKISKRLFILAVGQGITLFINFLEIFVN
jgi:hypothetical protein